MELMGRLSLAAVPTTSVQVWEVASYLRAALSAAASTGKFAFQAAFQPESLGLFGFLPAPAAIMVCA